MTKSEDKMITQSTVLEMGFTKSMIEKLLPKPKKVRNPHYSCASPMKLWKEADVIAVMKKEEYITAFSKAQKRKKAAEKAVSTRAKKEEERTADIINKLSVLVLPEDELIERVLEDNKNRIISKMENELYYLERKLDNSYYLSREELESLENVVEELSYDIEYFEFKKPNPSTLARWVVNYIRHNLIDYDKSLYWLKGKMSQDSKYKKIKKEVLEKIANVYPAYEDECSKQIESIGYEYAIY